MASHGQMMAVNAVEQLPHLICLRLPMVILEIHNLPNSLMRIYHVRPLLALKRKPKDFGKFAEPREPEAGGIGSGQLQEFLWLHSDIICDIMQSVKTQADCSAWICITRR